MPEDALPRALRLTMARHRRCHEALVRGAARVRSTPAAGAAGMLRQERRAR